MMRLKVLLPTQILVDSSISNVSAEDHDGTFTLLPKHIDFVTALVPGLLSFSTAGSAEASLLAIDRGILVKRGQMVMVSTRAAVRGQDLKTLQQTVEQQFRKLDERERKAQAALMQLETAVIRQFIELKRL